MDEASLAARYGEDDGPPGGPKRRRGNRGGQGRRGSYPAQFSERDAMDEEGSHEEGEDRSTGSHDSQWLDNRYADEPPSRPAPALAFRGRGDGFRGARARGDGSRGRGRGRGDFRPPPTQDSGWGARAPQSSMPQWGAPIQQPEHFSSDFEPPAAVSAPMSAGLSSDGNADGMTPAAQAEERPQMPIHPSRRQPSPPRQNTLPAPRYDQHPQGRGMPPIMSRGGRSPPRSYSREVPPPRDNMPPRREYPPAREPPRRQPSPPRRPASPPRRPFQAERRRSASPPPRARPFVPNARPQMLADQFRPPQSGAFAEVRPAAASFNPPSGPASYGGRANPYMAQVIPAQPSPYAQETYARREPEDAGPMAAREAFNRQTAEAPSIAAALPVASPALAQPASFAPVAPRRLYTAPPVLLPDVVAEIAAIRAHRFGQLLRDDVASSAAARRSLRELSLREADGRLAAETTKLAEQQLERFSQSAAMLAA